jgi:hypothetical protein
LYPELSPIEIYLKELRTGDGYAEALLRDTLTALESKGIHLNIQTDDHTIEIINAERLLWGVPAYEPNTHHEHDSEGTEKIDEWVLRFFEDFNNSCAEAEKVS